MAQAQAHYQAYAQANKGTLLPGQTIAVNKYTVQVERYLSQGGFAHVYLVKTAQPVFNTTHHVLKRIAVPNETMLAEVKKEVDIMRLLRGHPNIVCLIDAAWHRMPNGTYEIFILMEFCPGGGIIDMMNRRLRERLTEQEILTIFVDVCEGLAAMHALKPPLLHRDLKVENILQASETSFKLCDFGSATPVQKVPTNTQEIRMLEADINRHTTLQYRAPEMVDVYLRRPIDEKSDVWALGVLLYKLCYYTTPFEEHGPLAILNVQYRFPPYPVYSQQLNSLIASILREHGTQRPSVFEILNHVHVLRGTKSRYSYPLPAKEPPLSPRSIAPVPLQTLSPNVMSPPSSALNPLQDLVSYASRQPSVSPAKNAGTEARDKVLEALAPMRRGRPASAVLSPPSSPGVDKVVVPLGAEVKFGVDDDRAWRGVRGHKSGIASFAGGATKSSSPRSDAWGLHRHEPVRDHKVGKGEENIRGFDSDFTSFQEGFGDSFQPARSPLPSPRPSQPQVQPSSISRPIPTPSKATPSHQLQPKDAFDGLGLVSQPPPPTLGEARHVRTGLALSTPTTQDAGSGTSGSPRQLLSVSGASQGLGIGTSSTMYRPPSSHSPIPPASSKPVRSASPQVDSRKSHGKLPSTASRLAELSAEQRFPSLEDLDREFASPPPAPLAVAKDRATTVLSRPVYTEPQTDKHRVSRPPSRQAGGVRTANLLNVDGAGSATAPGSSNRYDGVRSQHVTGSAMRESRMPTSRQASGAWVQGDYLTGGRDAPSSPSRPPLTRRHRSSITMKQPHHPIPVETSVKPALTQLSPPALPPRPSASPRQEPRDWLTGVSDGEATTSSQPVLRESPSKRASFIEKSPVQIQKPLEAVTGHHDWPTSEDFEKQIEQQQKEKERSEREQERRKEGARQATKAKSRSRTPSPTKPTAALVTRTSTNLQAPIRNLQIPGVDTKVVSQRSGGISPSGLTSNWSPIESTFPSKISTRTSISSSSDEGPEDVNGYLPQGTMQEKTKHHDGPTKDDTARQRRARGRDRQSSVHDLVDLWGGGLEKDDKISRPRSPEKSNSIVLPTIRPSHLSSKPSPSSQQLISTSPAKESPLGTTTSRFIPPRPPSSQQHRKEPSNVNKPTPSARGLPTPIHTSTSGRSRPQSMIITPTTKSVLESKNSLSSSVSSPSPQEALSPPAQDARTKRSIRRSSISDMVQRYEAIGGKGPASPAPATKPAGLKVVAGVGGSTGTGSNATVSSPSGAALKFPKLSRPSSPVVSKGNLAVPEDVGQPSAGRKDVPLRGRTSPTPSVTGLPSRGSVMLSNLSKPSAAQATAANGLPVRASPLPKKRPSPGGPTQDAPPTSPRKPLTPEDGVRSPSPEKPFEGVSKLIDRWQRAVDESGGSVEGDRGAGPRRLGGSLSGRGR